MTRKDPHRVRNLSITGLIALTGFISLFVVMGALFLGLWIDSQLGQRGPATICLLVLSMPVSLYLMVTIALRLVQQIEPPTTPINNRITSSDVKEE